MTEQQERCWKLDRLAVYFSKELAEDKIDGTRFDNAVLNAIETLKSRFGDIQGVKNERQAS